MALPKLGEHGVIFLLCYINLLNYIDRGIIPGAPETFQHFMTQTLGIDATEQNFYLGLLSSAFIASTAICSLGFGFLALSYRPFQLIAIGMGSWIVAVVICGIAYYVDSYYLLLFGRVLSGVGEASFHCNAMPFINRNAPKENSTLWLGLFIASITVGMAAGYVYGAALASTPLSWAGAFFIEGALMAPPVFMCVFCIRDDLDQVPKDIPIQDLQDNLLSPGSRTEAHETEADVVTQAFARGFSTSSSSSKTSGAASPQPQQEPFWTQWWRVFRNITFSLVAFGHAAYMFTEAAFSVFAPVILIGMGFFDDETDVSLVFGVVIVVSGTVGTVLGGLALDHMTKANTVPQEERCRLAVKLIFYLMIVTTACGLLMLNFTSSKIGFLLMLGVTFLFMSAIGPAETVAVMEMFPESRQSMAVAANTVIILLLGDIPSPVVLGWLKDTWAPLCGTVEIDGDLQLNPQCADNRSGIKGVLLFAVLWMVWAIALWGIAHVQLRRRKLRAKLASGIQSPVFA